MLFKVRDRRAGDESSPLDELITDPADVAEEAEQIEAGGRDRGSWSDLAGPVPRRMRRSKTADRLGWYEIREAARDALLTSTHQAPAAAPALMRTHVPFAGPPLGIDVSTGQFWASDPFTLYMLGVITSISVAVVGDVGSGKSSLAKCQYAVAQLAAGRQVVVFDRKKSETESEYWRLELFVRASGLTVARVKASRRGLSRVNVMDPQIVANGDAEGGLVGQDTLLGMVVNVSFQSSGEPPMTTEEGELLGIAQRRAQQTAKAEGRDPDIRDVAYAMFNPNPDDLPYGSGRFTTEAGMFESGRRVAYALQAAITGSLSGLIDGPTADENGNPLNLDADLLIIDTSELEDGSAALAMFLAIMTTYLGSVWEIQQKRSVAIIEEGYSANLPVVGSVFRTRAKRGRGVGLSLVFVVHHYGDVPADSDIAALYREVGITHIFGQAGELEAKQAAAVLGVPQLVDTFTTLDRGEHILFEGSPSKRPPRRIVSVMTDAERWLTWTDSAIQGAEQSPPMPDSVRQWLDRQRQQRQLVAVGG